MAASDIDELLKYLEGNIAHRWREPEIAADYERWIAAVEELRAKNCHPKCPCRVGSKAKPDFYVDPNSFVRT